MTDISVTQKPTQTPTAGDLLVGVTADGTVKLFPVAEMPNADATATAADIEAARQDAITQAVAQSDAAADAGDATTLAAAQAYADTGDATTLAAANAYADTVAAGGGVSEATVDSKDAATLASANSHADTAAANAQSAAQSYADTGDATTLSSAQAYTDAATVGGNFVPGGTGSVSRSMNVKVKEIEVSVLDYGADPTGVADSTNAFQNAIRSGAARVHVPVGLYTVSSFDIDRFITMYGDGRTLSIVDFTTSTDHAVDILGDSDYYANGDDSNIVRINQIQFRKKSGSTPQIADKHGVFIRTQVVFDELFVNKFTHTGIFTDTWDGDSLSSDASINPGNNSRSVFFAEMRNTWSKNNGDYGLEVRFGANANLFINMKLDKNGINGLYHHSGNGLTGNRFQASATYGSTFIGGQASYNGREGWNFDSGSNINAIGLYAEGNGRGTGDVAYVTTQFDYRINTTKSNFMLGTVQGVARDHVQIVNPADRTTMVSMGGVRLTAMMGKAKKVAANATLAQLITAYNDTCQALFDATISSGTA